MIRSAHSSGHFGFLLVLVVTCAGIVVAVLYTLGTFNSDSTTSIQPKSNLPHQNGQNNTQESDKPSLANLTIIEEIPYGRSKLVIASTKPEYKCTLLANANCELFEINGTTERYIGNMQNYFDYEKRDLNAFYFYTFFGDGNSSHANLKVYDNHSGNLSDAVQYTDIWGIAGLAGYSRLLPDPEMVKVNELCSQEDEYFSLTKIHERGVEKDRILVYCHREDVFVYLDSDQNATKITTQVGEDVSNLEAEALRKLLLRLNFENAETYFAAKNVLLKL